jgi:ATP-binding cassette subfamily B protein
LIDHAYEPVAIFNVIYVQYRLDMAAFKRYDDFLALKDDDQLNSEIIPEKIYGDIKIDNLSFAYGGRTIILSLSLDIGGGGTVALVGERGSGKSTLIL